MPAPTVIVPDMIRIPHGRFLMGDDAGRADERPSHLVTLAAFSAAISPVTNAAYAAFLGHTRGEAPPFWHLPQFGAPDQPVVGVSWADASAYCDWLASLTGRRIRL